MKFLLPIIITIFLGASCSKNIEDKELEIKIRAILKKIENEKSPKLEASKPRTDELTTTLKKDLKNEESHLKSKPSPISPENAKIKKFLEKEKMAPNELRQFEQEEKTLTKEELAKIKSHEAEIQTKTKEQMRIEASRGDQKARY